MTGRKRLLTLGSLGLALLLLLAGMIVVALAGGGPAPPPYAFKEVGPKITGTATLTPAAGDMKLDISFKGICKKKEVTVTAALTTQKPASTLTDAEIKASATKFFVAKGAFQMTGDCQAKTSTGDLIIVKITDLKATRAGGKLTQATCKATLSFIDKKK